MKIVARQLEFGTFLLEFFPERVQMAGPYVTLYYTQPFGKEEWAATVTWSAIGPVESPAALEFGASVRAAAMTAFDLTNGKVTVEQLLKLWRPLPTPQAVTP
jgi:hypothetical protein